MACSCSSTSIASFTGGASTSSHTSSSSSSTAASFSFHLQHQIPSVSSTNALLRWDCEKSTRQATYLTVTARQGHYDKPKRNTSQRGVEGGRYSNVAVKEDKAGRKGGSSGSRNPKLSNNNSNPRPYSSSSNPRSQNSSYRNRTGRMLANVEEDEDEEDSDEEVIVRNSESNPKASKVSRSSMSLSYRNEVSRLSVVSHEEEEDEDDDDFEFDEEDDLESGQDGSTEQLIMPIPPAGFVLAEDGSVSLMAPPHKRITTLVDPETKMPLDCLIRRVFSSSDGRQCYLLCPLDTPLQILRIEDGDVLSEISDKELVDILPTASYELAKQRLHLVQSGFCLTLRGGFCFSEEDVIDLNTVYNGNSDDNKFNEGVEVANVVLNDSEYLIFTPFDPLMFVAYKDEKTGELLIAEDELLDDEAVLDAIDEEKEFQAYMEEEVLMASSDEDEE